MEYRIIINLGMAMDTHEVGGMSMSRPDSGRDRRIGTHP